MTDRIKKRAYDSHRVSGQIGPVFGENRVEFSPKHEQASPIASKLENLVTVQKVVKHDHTRYAKVGDGFYLVASQLPPNTRFETPLVGEAFFDIHFCLRGELTLVGNWGEVRFEGPRLLFWYHPPGHSDVFEEVEGGKAGYSGISLYCDRRWLKTQAIGNDKTINEIWDTYVLKPPNTPQFRVLPPPYGSDRIIRKIMRERDDDALNFLQLKGSAFELFALAFGEHVTQNKNESLTQYKDNDIHKFSAVRELLYADYKDPPSIKELARIVGLNSSKLMAGFKHTYGETIGRMVLRLKMEEARRLLLTSEEYISSVAYKVGYSHHSSFTAAFTQYFGVTPHQILPPTNAKNRSAEGGKDETE